MYHSNVHTNFKTLRTWNGQEYIKSFNNSSTVLASGVEVGITSMNLTGHDVKSTGLFRKIDY